MANVVGPHPYTGWQQALDPLLTPGARNYWKSHYFKSVTDAMIDVFLEYADTLPSPHCEIAFAQLGGAINSVAATATAYPHRDVNYTINIHTRWMDAADDAKCIAWCRSLFDALAPHGTGGVYVNFMPEDEPQQRVAAAAYGPNYEKLTKVKAKYDPNNLFRHNQNITPAK